MLLKHGIMTDKAVRLLGFSTLYRVDAIEAAFPSSSRPRPGPVSVPSIGSMLLKRAGQSLPLSCHFRVSVPSIGSMLLKRWTSTPGSASCRSFSTLYRVDAIEARTTPMPMLIRSGFSTLYRVDAIEASLQPPHHRTRLRFQYPLSGRCY